MNRYVQGVDAIAGGTRTLARFADVLGVKPVAEAPQAQSSLSSFLSRARAQEPDDIRDGVNTLAGAATGYFVWRDHRYLGGAAGASLGRNALALLDPRTRHKALRNMSVTASGILGSLTLSKKYPILGFALGWLAAGAAFHMGDPK